MDPPVQQDEASLRCERARLLRAIVPLCPDEVVRGQFRGYRAEPGVSPDSQVETFVAVRLWIDNWRWAGVPFCIRAGKCLAVTVTEVWVTLKSAPRVLPGSPPPGPSHVRFRLSPDVKIAVGVSAKVPGEAMRGEPVELVASHNRGDTMLAYERLLGDALRGDRTLFATEGTVESEWRAVDPVLRAATPLYYYDPGSFGPEQAARLAAPSGWHDPVDEPASLQR
jgi:glucose-6-phosphate 1-dehydrogenase